VAPVPAKTETMTEALKLAAQTLYAMRTIGARAACRVESSAASRGSGLSVAADSVFGHGAPGGRPGSTWRY
jgi:hypothetical protein